MDTKIKALILLLFSAFTTFAQTPGINFAAKFNITSATGGDPYNITGIVLDDLSRFTGSDVQVNDSIYVIDGDQLYVLAVTSITSVVGPTVTLVANDPNNAGVSIPTGQAAICRPTDNYKLPLYISGLRDDLRSMVMNRQAQLIDDINGSAVSAITDFTSAGVNVPPSPAASLNGGETWRNMTTGELWGSDGNVWYPYTRGPKECQDTVLVSAITVQSGGSVTTGSPLIRNSSGVWEHMYNHPSGLNLIPDGVVTDIIVGGKAIVQYCGVRKGSGATPNTSYYVNQSISTGFTTTKPITDIRPLGKVASNGDFLINAGLLFSRDNALNQIDSYLGDLIYSTNYYTTTSDFTAVNTTPVAQDGYIRLSGGDGSINNYLTLNVTPITDENLVISATYRMSGSTSVNGMGIGKRSINSWFPVSVHGTFVPNNNSISLWVTSSSTKISEVFLGYTPAIGDILKLTYIESEDQVSLVFEDLTQKKINIINAYDNYLVGSSFLLPNTGVPAVYNQSGTIDLLSLKVYTSSRSPYIVTIGDSKTKGGSSGGSTLRYPSLLLNKGNTQVFAGNGDRTIEMVQSIVSIASKKPKYAILNLGRNDLASSVSSGTWQTNYTRIVDTLEAYGVDVIHLLPIPEKSGLDQSSLRTWILANYSGETVDTTGFVRATMVSTDNIHPNELGYKQIAKNIISSGLIATESPKTIKQGLLQDSYRGLSNTISGSGSINNIPRLTGSKELGNSAISDNGSLVSSTNPMEVNTTNEEKFTFRGSNNPTIRFKNAANSDLAILQASSGFVRLYSFGNIPVVLSTNNVSVFFGLSTSVEVGRTGGYGLPGTFIHGFNDVSTDYALVVAPLTFTIGTAPLVVTNGARVGMKTNVPQRDLDVNGEVRIRDLTTDTPTRFVGADVDGDLGEIATTGNVKIVGGVINVATTLMREESFTATAAQTAFTIAYSAPAVSGTSVPIRVYRNGVRLFYVASGPTITQFTYSGTTVTTAANTTGDIITIEYLN